MDTATLIGAAVIALGCLLLALHERRQHWKVIERVSRGGCWLDYCSLPAGHKGLHDDSKLHEPNEG